MDWWTVSALSNEVDESTTRKEDINDAADAENDDGGGRRTRRRCEKEVDVEDGTDKGNDNG